MAVPFSSSYQPINQLNAAIMAQDQLAQQAALQRRQMDNQGVNEAMNRIIQQRALEQQGRNQQQHYGLQQQQLANDLAYRNAALGQGNLARTEQARQFDAQLGLNKQLTDAQIKAMQNPFYGQKDAAAFGMQAAQDVAKYNQDALSGESEANRALELLDTQHKAATAKIKGEFHPFKQGELLREADAAYTAALIGIQKSVGHGDKIRFNPSTGKYEALKLNVPLFGQRESQIALTTTPTPAPAAIPDAAPFPAAWPRPAQSTTPVVPLQAAIAPAGILNRLAPASAPIFNPFAAYSAMRQQQSQPVRTNAVPPIVAIPPAEAATPASQAVEGTHFRTNPDGSVIVLLPLIGDSGGKVILPGSILRP